MALVSVVFRRRETLSSQRVSYSFLTNRIEKEGEKEDTRKEEYRRNETYGSYHGEEKKQFLLSKLYVVML